MDLVTVADLITMSSTVTVNHCWNSGNAMQILRPDSALSTATSTRDRLVELMSVGRTNPKFFKMKRRFTVSCFSSSWLSMTPLLS